MFGGFIIRLHLCCQFGICFYSMTFLMRITKGSGVPFLTRRLILLVSFLIASIYPLSPTVSRRQNDNHSPHLYDIIDNLFFGFLSFICNSINILAYIVWVYFHCSCDVFYESVRHDKTTRRTDFFDFLKKCVI